MYARPSAGFGGTTRCHSMCKQHAIGCRHSPPTTFWVIAFISVVTLTIVNIVVAIKLMSSSVKFQWADDVRRVHRTATEPTSTNSQVKCHEPTQSLESAFQFSLSTGRFDKTLKYKTHEFVLVGDRWGLAPRPIVCVATQTSVDKLHWIVDVARHWQGPISVAVFIPHPDYAVAVQYLSYLRRCFPDIRANTTVHFTYPVSQTPAVPKSPSEKVGAHRNDSCSEWPRVLQRLLLSRPHQALQRRLQLLYPQNHLRNVARKTCQAEFVFLTDVDIIPRWGLAASLTHFLTTEVVRLCNRCAYVIPTYEVDDKAPLPKDKAALLALVQRKKAQPFHNVTFVHNQYATNNSHWQNLPEGDRVTIAFPVTNFEFYYEPFYVAKDDVPVHDERFIGYGFTRNTQVYEMFISDYKFLVLNYAFAMHRGMKTRNVRHVWRDRQNRANGKMLKRFEQEIYVRHGRDLMPKITQK